MVKISVESNYDDDTTTTTSYNHGLMLLRRQLLAPSTVCRLTRCYSTRPSSAVKGAARSSSSRRSVAKSLVGLSTQDRTEPLTQQEADAEAREWLESFRQSKADWIGPDGKYRPGRVFAPEGTTEVDLVEQVLDEQMSRKFEPSDEQLLEAERAKSAPIPPVRDETVNFLVNLIMRHGKKARAEKLMNQALYLVHLRLRQSPAEVLKQVLEDMGPLVKLKRYTDGGARSELVPIPLSPRQRIHQAWAWIVEAANKRGSKDFSVRLAEEIIAASQGNSPGFEKRDTQHKTAVVNRAFVKMLQKR